MAANIDTAMQYYTDAVAQGRQDAKISLKALRQQTGTAPPEAAKPTDAESIFKLAIAYDIGSGDLSKHHVRAHQLYKKP